MAWAQFYGAESAMKADQDHPADKDHLDVIYGLAEGHTARLLVMRIA
jgi:hypothetical protein